MWWRGHIRTCTKAAAAAAAAKTTTAGAAAAKTAAATKATACGGGPASAGRRVVDGFSRLQRLDLLQQHLHRVDHVIETSLPRRIFHARECSSAP